MTLGLRGRIVLAAGAAVAAALALAVAGAVFLLPAAAGYQWQWLWPGLALGAVIVAAALAVLGAVLKPLVLDPLAQAVQAIARMPADLDEPVASPPARHADELAQLTERLQHLAQAAARRDHELAAARDAAADAQRARSQFMAVMSHELRTPLNAVLGMAELLHGSRLDERQQRFVTQIRDSGRALVAIIDDVLELTRLQAGMVVPARQPFRLREAVLAGVEPFRAAAQARALELGVHVDEALPGVVRGDRAQLQQILSKLLSNAVKFTERGGVIVRVTPSETRVRFSVSDTGIGIAGEFMPHLYEAFRQADSSPTRRFGGAGLGLAIARRRCLAMGGLIDASSRPGKGSTFWFELPLPVEPGGMPDAAIEQTPASTPP